MRIRATDIVRSVISVTLVRGILEYFCFKRGLTVCLTVALVLYLVAKGSEVTVERLEKNKNGGYYKVTTLIIVMWLPFRYYIK